MRLCGVCVCICVWFFTNIRRQLCDPRVEVEPKHLQGAEGEENSGKCFEVVVFQRNFPQGAKGGQFGGKR